jgi:hypothetical protein
MMPRARAGTPKDEERDLGPSLAPEDLWPERDAMLAKIARMAAALAVIMETPRLKCPRCDEAARISREALR